MRHVQGMWTKKGKGEAFLPPTLHPWKEKGGSFLARVFQGLQRGVLTRHCPKRSQEIRGMP